MMVLADFKIHVKFVRSLVGFDPPFVCQIGRFEICLLLVKSGCSVRGICSKVSVPAFQSQNYHHLDDHRIGTPNHLP